MMLYPPRYETTMFQKFDGRKGDLRTVPHFLDSMDAFARNGALCLGEFPKSLIDIATPCTST